MSLTWNVSDNAVSSTEKEVITQNAIQVQNIKFHTKVPNMILLWKSIAKQRKQYKDTVLSASLKFIMDKSLAVVLTWKWKHF